MDETTYYESDEYEDAANPGTYAAVVITRCDDGPHFKFMCAELTILDLEISALEALAIGYELTQAGQDTLDAARRPTPQLPELPADHVHVEHDRIGPADPRPLEPGYETAYGQREAGPADRRPVGPYMPPPEITGRPERVTVPPGRRYEVPEEATSGRDGLAARAWQFPGRRPA